MKRWQVIIGNNDTVMEFGSDYHSLTTPYYTGCTSLRGIYPSSKLMADGRQPLIAIIRQENYRRLWVPEYFCYEVLESVRKHTDVELIPYKDFPGMKDGIEKLPFREGDAILRMNFFGMKECESMEALNVPVIEDHSHDLLSRWALYSRVDWCLASLRKSLPTAEGGMVWSPKGKELSVPEKVTPDNAALAADRWKAMDMKAEYLQGKEVSKEAFRELYVQTEEGLDSLELSAVDQRSAEVVERLDINKWYRAKKQNWKLLSEHLTEKVDYLKPDDDSCTPFSMVLKFESEEQREQARKAMIADAVYPAVLWRVPQECSEPVRKVSGCLLSVHCDGRYSEEEMMVLAERINRIIEKL